MMILEIENLKLAVFLFEITRKLKEAREEAMKLCQRHVVLAQS